MKIVYSSIIISGMVVFFCGCTAGSATRGWLNPEPEKTPEPPKPDTVETVYWGTKIIKDEFDTDLQVMGPTRELDGQPRTLTPGIIDVGGIRLAVEGYVIRSLTENSIQIYACVSDSRDWHFLEGAVGVGGESLAFTPIYRRTWVSGGAYSSVYCVEVVGVSIPLHQLRKVASTGMRIRLNGRQKNKVITLPAHYIKGYLKKHDEAFRSIDPVLEKAIREQSRAFEDDLPLYTDGLAIMENLNLKDMGLKRIPVGIEILPNLKGLGLDGNQIVSVEGLEKLKRLTFITLRNNNLKSFPAGMRKLVHLEMLELKGNPNLTQEQIEELKRDLPNLKIYID